MKQIKYMYIGAGFVTLVLTVAILDMLYNESAEVGIYVTSLLGVCTFFFTAVLAINAYQQNLISKQNIKLKLFDKRYKVFEVIVSSCLIFNEKNYSNQVLIIGIDDPNFINKKIIASVEQMRDAAILSESLFDKKLFNKIYDTYVKYKALSDMHFEIFKQLVKVVDNREFLELYQEFLLETDEVVIAEIESKLNIKYPTFQKLNNQFNVKLEEFNQWIKEEKLYKCFDTYLLINELDTM
ncbi:MAG: hypothetical protein R3Y59_08055 [bacterium]